MSGTVPHGVAAAGLYSPISQAHAIMEMSMPCQLCVCVRVTQSAQAVSDQPKQLDCWQCLLKKPGDGLHAALVLIHAVVQAQEELRECLTSVQERLAAQEATSAQVCPCSWPGRCLLVMRRAWMYDIGARGVPVVLLAELPVSFKCVMLVQSTSDTASLMDPQCLLSDAAEAADTCHHRHPGVMLITLTCADSGGQGGAGC